MLYILAPLHQQICNTRTAISSYLRGIPLQKAIIHHFIPLEVSLELDCFAWAGTTDRDNFRDDVVMERTEP